MVSTFRGKARMEERSRRARRWILLGAGCSMGNGSFSVVLDDWVVILLADVE